MVKKRTRAPAATRPPAAGVVVPRTIWWRAVLLLAVGWVAYASSLSGPFLFDDQTAIVNNPSIRTLSPVSVPLAPPRDTPVAGRPIVNLSFALNYAWGGLDVRSYHAVNVAIHLVASLLLFGVVRRVLLLPKLAPRFATSATSLAWACAALWALHPLQTEVVNYLTERTESLMGLFYLLTIYCSVRALERGARWWQVATVAASAIGMACKESMATVPIIALLLDRVLVFDSWREAFTARRSVYSGLACTWVVVGALLLTAPRSSAGFSSGIDPWTYLLNQTRMIVRYLELAVWPRRLVLDYGLPQPLTVGDVLVPATIVLGLLLITVAALMVRPMIGLLGACFWITLAPSSSIFPVATEVGAERRMYLPLAALVVLGVIGLYALAGQLYRRLPPISAERGQHRDGSGARAGARQAAGGIVLAIVLLLMIAGVRLRAREYASPLVMAQTIVDRWPNGRGRFQLGAELIGAGRHDEAMAQFRASARDYPGAFFALGTEQLASGEIEEGMAALQEFIRALPTHPNVVAARDMLGRAYLAQGKLELALEQYTLVLRQVPEHAVASQQMGDIRLRQARPDEAITHYRASLAIQPNNAVALRSLGYALASTGRFAEAEKAFREAIARNGSDALAHNLLGRVLVEQRQFAAAAEQFQQALRIDPAYQEARANLDAIAR